MSFILVNNLFNEKFASAYYNVSIYINFNKIIFYTKKSYENQFKNEFARKTLTKIQKLLNSRII